jgi:hypothetical protein
MRIRDLPQYLTDQGVPPQGLPIEKTRTGPLHLQGVKIHPVGLKMVYLRCQDMKHVRRTLLMLHLEIKAFPATKLRHRNRVM